MLAVVELREGLADWTDWDVAAMVLGQVLGVISDQASLSDVKGVFWTDDELGNGLRAALLALVEADVFERRDEPDEQFRWCWTR